MQNIALHEEPHKIPTKAMLRAALQAHMEDFNDPILAALQGLGLPVLEAVSLWVDLGAVAELAREYALAAGCSLQEANEEGQRRALALAQELKAEAEARQ